MHVANAICVLLASALAFASPVAHGGEDTNVICIGNMCFPVGEAPLDAADEAAVGGLPVIKFVGWGVGILPGRSGDHLKHGGLRVLQMAAGGIVR